MYNLGDLVCQNLFCVIDFRALESSQATNLVHGQEGQKSQTLLYLHVFDVSPVLVELVGRGLFRIKPYGALHGLAHLDTLAGGQKLEGQTVCRLILFSADQLYAADDIGPLVIAAHLHLTAVHLIQLQEIVGLHDHVVKLEEGQSLLHSLLVALSGQHPVYGEMCSHLTQEIHIIQIQQPVRVIRQNRVVIVEVDETGQLISEAVRVVLNGFLCHNLTHIGLAGGVSYHGSSAA